MNLGAATPAIAQPHVAWMCALRQGLANALALMGLALLAFAAAPLNAQELEVFDPNDALSETPQDSGAIDGDLAQPSPADGPVRVQPALRPLPPMDPQPPQPVPAPSAEPSAWDQTSDLASAPQETDEAFAVYSEPPQGTDSRQWVDPASGATIGEGPLENTADGAGIVDVPQQAAASDTTYAEDDLIGAAEGVFGKGAKGLAKLIEDLLKKEGQPNGYIVGREAGGAFIFGARYGSGTLHHKIEGDRKVYWTGPSVGFDAGANAANTFVLVYNLFDTEDLFKRYPAGEGQAYLVGGLHASYMRRGDVVLIPIRLGAGVRLGINAGYMKFSKKQRWLPF
ncbi:MAG: DUF1134 domain-containing protein [Pseudomonadota bacterium]